MFLYFHRFKIIVSKQLVSGIVDVSEFSDVFRYAIFHYLFSVCCRAILMGKAHEIYYY